MNVRILSNPVCALTLAALGFGLSACSAPQPATGTPAQPAAAASVVLRSPELQRAIQAVEAFHASRGSWPVSLSQVGVADRSLSYEADSAGCRITDARGARYDSRERR